MDGIVEQLVKIEDKAQKISKEAYDKELNLQAQIDDAVKKIAAEIDEKTAKILEEIRNNSNADDKVLKLQALNQKQFEQMENEYVNYRKQWINELFNSIIGR